MSDAITIDVREIPPRNRHSLIIQAYQALGAGGSLLLQVDHDPKPLQYQFDAEYNGAFSWQYLEQGPDLWRVRIGRT